MLHRIQITEYRVQNYKMRAPGPLLYNMSYIVRNKCFIFCHLIDSNALSQNLLHLLHRFCSYFSGPIVKCYSNVLYHNVQTSVSAVLLKVLKCITKYKPLYHLYNTDCIISALSSAASRPEGGNEFSAGGASNYNLCHDFLHCCENISFKPVL